MIYIQVKSVFFDNNYLRKLLHKNLLRLNISLMKNFMEGNILRLEAVYNMWWKPQYGGHFAIHENMLESSANKNKRCIIFSCKEYYKYVSHKF